MHFLQCLYRANEFGKGAAELSAENVVPGRSLAAKFSRRSTNSAREDMLAQATQAA